MAVSENCIFRWEITVTVINTSAEGTKDVKKRLGNTVLYHSWWLSQKADPTRYHRWSRTNACLIQLFPSLSLGSVKDDKLILEAPSSQPGSRSKRPRRDTTNDLLELVVNTQPPKEKKRFPEPWSDGINKADGILNIGNITGCDLWWTWTLSRTKTRQKPPGGILLEFEKLLLFLSAFPFRGRHSESVTSI